VTRTHGCVGSIITLPFKYARPSVPQESGDVARTAANVTDISATFHVRHQAIKQFPVERFGFQLVDISMCINMREAIVAFSNLLRAVSGHIQDFRSKPGCQSRTNVACAT